MPYWRHNLNLYPIWEKARNNEITPQKMGKLVYAAIGDQLASQINSHSPFYDAILDIARNGFNDLPDDATFDDFDDALDVLYNWADEDHKCWINTFSSPNNTTKD